MWVEISVAIITGIFAIVVAMIGKNKKLQEQNKELSEKNRKIEIELSAITVLFNHRFLNLMNDCIDEIMSNTKTTRFLFLFAVNGKESFNTVTACFEKNIYPEYSGATKRYVRMPIDHEYKIMLRNVEAHGKEILDVEEMRPSLLKSIYKSYNEQVQHSIIHFISRIPIDERNDLLLYCSTATIDDEPYTEEESFIIDRCISLMRNEAKNSLSAGSSF